MEKGFNSDRRKFLKGAVSVAALTIFPVLSLADENNLDMNEFWGDPFSEKLKQNPDVKDFLSWKDEPAKQFAFLINQLDAEPSRAEIQAVKEILLNPKKNKQFTVLKGTEFTDLVKLEEILPEDVLQIQITNPSNPNKPFLAERMQMEKDDMEFYYYENSHKNKSLIKKHGYVIRRAKFTQGSRIQVQETKETFYRPSAEFENHYGKWSREQLTEFFMQQAANGEYYNLSPVVRPLDILTLPVDRLRVIACICSELDHVRVSSARRSEETNKVRSGFDSESYHLYGAALDFVGLDHDKIEGVLRKHNLYHGRNNPNGVIKRVWVHGNGAMRHAHVSFNLSAPELIDSHKKYGKLKNSDSFIEKYYAFIGNGKIKEAQFLRYLAIKNGELSLSDLQFLDSPKVFFRKNYWEDIVDGTRKSAAEKFHSYFSDPEKFKDLIAQMDSPKGYALDTRQKIANIL